MTEEVRFEIDGKEYFIGPVNANVLANAQKVYNQTFRKALDDGAMLKKRLEIYMREEGLWDSKKEEERLTLIKQIADLEYKLKKSKKLTEGRDISIQLSKLRNKFFDLVNERNYLDSVTAEGQAEAERFNAILVNSLFDFLTRKPIFASLQEYKEKFSDQLAIKLTAKFATHFYGDIADFENNLPEHKFLKRFKLMDDKGFLVNKDGKRVDEDGNLLDEDGYKIDVDGNRIDINNNLVEDSIDIETMEVEDDFFNKPEDSTL